MADRPRAEIVCVGTELLAGKVNTHVAYLSALLRSAGLDVRLESTAVDSREEIREAVAAAYGRADVVIVCGGLGPTFDDLTREGVSDALQRPLRYDPALFDRIRRTFFRYRLSIPASNKRQAWTLSGARVLPNARGSAPGQLVTTPSKTLAILPGPFSELKPMFEGQVLPILRRRHGAGVALERVFRFAGISEAAAGERLKPVLRQADGFLDFTILAGTGLVELHANVCAPTKRSAAARMARVDAGVRRVLGRYLYGLDDDTLESALGRRLKSRRWTLAVAESCTGGLVAQRLTSVAGSSDYFLGGIVAYDNRVKLDVLGVREETLRRFGAVSAACAREMAEGARRRLGADVGVALTGIAGPGGGSKAKPVGLVYTAWALPARTLVREQRFFGDRAQVRERASNAALHALYQCVI